MHICVLALSFVELMNYLFTVPGVTYILSETFCQDPHKNFLESRVCYCDNPKVNSFLKGSVSIRIQGTMAKNLIRECSRGKKRKKTSCTVNTVSLL